MTGKPLALLALCTLTACARHPGTYPDGELIGHPTPLSNLYIFNDLEAENRCYVLDNGATLPASLSCVPMNATPQPEPRK